MEPIGKDIYKEESNVVLFFILVIQKTRWGQMAEADSDFPRDEMELLQKIRIKPKR